MSIMETAYHFRFATDSDEEAIHELCRSKKLDFSLLRGLFQMSCTSSLWNVFVAESTKTGQVIGCMALLATDNATTVVDMFFQVSSTHHDQRMISKFSKHCYSYVAQKYKGLTRRRGNYSIDVLLKNCHTFSDFRVITENISSTYICKPITLEYINRPGIGKRPLNLDDFLHAYKSNKFIRSMIKDGILQVGGESFDVNKLSLPEYSYLSSQSLMFLNSEVNHETSLEENQPDQEYKQVSERSVVNKDVETRRVITMVSMKKIRLTTNDIAFRITMYGQNSELTVEHFAHCLKLIFAISSFREHVTLAVILSQKSADILQNFIREMELECDEADKPLIFCRQAVPCWLIDMKGDLAQVPVIM